MTINKSAIEKLIDDPQFRHIGKDVLGSATPLLYYYHRSFSTLDDGTVIQHGDGFMLTYASSDDIRKAKDIAYKTVTVADRLEIIIGGPRPLISGTFTVGWTNGKFTFES